MTATLAGHLSVLQVLFKEDRMEGLDHLFGEGGLRLLLWQLKLKTQLFKVILYE